jgi:hypothetical protein
MLHRIWEYLISDRGLSVVSTVLSVVAIVLGLAGIWRAEYLFKKLDNTLEHLIEGMKKNMLREGVTVTASYAAFTRALQAVELDPMELPKDGAFALLTGFRFQQLLNPEFTPEQQEELRRLDRANVDKAARVFVDQVVKSGMGKHRDDIEMSEPTK